MPSCQSITSIGKVFVITIVLWRSVWAFHFVSDPFSQDQDQQRPVAGLPSARVVAGQRPPRRHLLQRTDRHLRLVRLHRLLRLLTKNSGQRHDLFDRKLLRRSLFLGREGEVSRLDFRVDPRRLLGKDQQLLAVAVWLPGNKCLSWAWPNDVSIIRSPLLSKNSS